MATISFDRDEYKAGETATITYVDALACSLVGIWRNGLIIHRKVLVSEGSGSLKYTAPTTLGKYEVVLFVGGRVRASDTMKVTGWQSNAKHNRGGLGYV